MVKIQALGCFLQVSSLVEFVIIYNGLGCLEDVGFLFSFLSLLKSYFLYMGGIGTRALADLHSLSLAVNDIITCIRRRL